MDWGLFSVGNSALPGHSRIWEATQRSPSFPEICIFIFPIERLLYFPFTCVNHPSKCRNSSFPLGESSDMWTLSDQTSPASAVGPFSFSPLRVSVPWVPFKVPCRLACCNEARPKQSGSNKMIISLSDKF